MIVPNIETFGGVGDDHTIMSVANFAQFQAAMASASAGYIPRGRFRVPGTVIATGCRLYGEGDVSCIRTIRDEHAPSISLWASTPHGPHAAVENLRILPAMNSGGVVINADGNYGISVHNQPRNVIDRVTIEEHRIGIYQHDSWGFIVNNCFITDALGCAILVPNTGGNSAAITNNSIYCCGSTLHHAGIDVTNAGGLICKGNDIENGWGAGRFVGVLKSDIGPNWSEGMASFNWQYEGCDSQTMWTTTFNVRNGDPSM